MLHPYKTSKPTSNTCKNGLVHQLPPTVARPKVAKAQSSLIVMDMMKSDASRFVCITIGSSFRAPVNAGDRTTLPAMLDGSRAALVICKLHTSMDNGLIYAQYTWPGVMVLAASLFFQCTKRFLFYKTSLLTFRWISYCTNDTWDKVKRKGFKYYYVDVIYSMINLSFWNHFEIHETKPSVAIFRQFCFSGYCIFVFYSLYSLLVQT